MQSSVLDALAGLGGLPALTEAILPFGTTTIDPDDRLYRRVTGGAPFATTLRDLPPELRTRLQETGLRQHYLNPLAGRLAELPRDFAIGEGVRPTAPDPTVQAWLDAFWSDPINAMDELVDVLAVELELLGEAVFPLFVGTDGRTRLTLIDPLVIVRTRPDPGNARAIIGVELASSIPMKPYVLPTLLGVAVDEAAMLSAEAVRLRTEWRAALPAVFGSEAAAPRGCLYASVGRIAGMSRGVAPIWRLIDHLQLIDETQFDMLERIKILNAFAWDVTLTGADQPLLDAWLARHPTPPKPATVNVHNEKESWTAVAPDLKAADLTTGFRTARNYVVGNAGYAPHFLGDVDANLATATASSDPAMKTIASRQTRLRRILTTLLQHVVAFGLEAGGSTMTPTLTIRGTTRPTWQTVGVQMPDPSPKDVGRIATAFAQLASGIATAVTGGYLSRTTATKLLVAMTPHLGVHDIDAQDEAAAIETDAAAETAAAYARVLAARTAPAVVPEPDPELINAALRR